MTSNARFVVIPLVIKSTGPVFSSLMAKVIKVIKVIKTILSVTTLYCTGM